MQEKIRQAGSIKRYDELHVVVVSQDKLAPADPSYCLIL